MAIGRWITDHGIPSTDILSAAHPDAPWSPFQTGYELLVAWLDTRGGLDLLRWVHAAIFATGLSLAVRFFWKQTGRLWIVALLALCLLTLYDERLRLRPHALNLLFETAVILPFAAGRWRLAPGRWGLLIVATALLWAFVHAMAVFWLLAVVGTVVVAGATARDRRWGLSALGLSALAVALAPGAADGIGHVFAIQGRWGPFVPELAPSWAWFELGSTYGIVCGLLPWVAATAVGAVILWKPQRERWPAVLAAAGLAFGAVWMVRLSYYAPLAVALVAPELGAVLGTRRLSASMRVVTVGLAILLGAHVLPRWQAVDPWTTTLQPDQFPEVEAEVLREAGIGGRIFNETEWGGYLLYVLHPRATVVSDGRVTFQEDVAALLEADENPQRRGEVLETAWRQYGVDLAVRRRGIFGGHPSWELLLRGPVADVWSRKGPVTAARRAALAAIPRLRKGGP